MKFISFFICIWITTHAFAQINTFYVAPSLTEPTYSAVQDSHMVVRNTASNNDKLFLFIGGTGSRTEGYKRISEFAGRLGFDVLNISYPNSVSAVSLAGATDSLAFDDFRNEICYGRSVSATVSVDSLNAIYTRVVNLIRYLDATYPTQNWRQYIKASGTLNWSKIVIGGHSQGAGHACYFGKYESPERVLMFSGPNDFSDHFMQAAHWLGIPGITPVNRHYVYLSLLDEVVDFSKQLQNMRELGLYPASDTVHVDGINSPYQNSRCLYTTQSPGVAILHHNATVKFSAINNAVWEYMLTAETLTHMEEMEDNHAFSIYPNPTSAQLHVRFHANMLGKTYTIRRITGQIIALEKVKSPSISVKLDNLVSGPYFFSIGNQTSMFIKSY